MFVARIIRNARIQPLCSAYRSIQRSAIRLEKNDDSDGTKLSEARELVPRKYRIFDESNNEIIYESNELDVILNRKQTRGEQRKTRHERVMADLQLRGEHGVFDIEELVRLLRDEKLKDIVVIDVPKEMRYCQHLVICTARSWKELKSFIELLNGIYKVKKSKKDPFLQIDDKCRDWRLLDMGNIIMHVMLSETREYYDLETLWCVGQQFDEKAQRVNKEANIVGDIITKHIQFIKTQTQSNI